jgi:peptide/nickel transport system substrate-binding protein
MVNRPLRTSPALIFALVAILVAGCAPSAPPSAATTASKPAAPAAAATAAPAASQKPLTIVQSAEPTSLDTSLDTIKTSVRIQYLIMEAPTRYDWDGKDIKLAPSLATSWENINPTTWRFKLRDGVKFQNGEDLTADAVKFSLDTFKGNQGMGSTNFNQIKDIVVVDPKTFDVVTATPFAAAPASLSFLTIFPPKYYVESGGKEGFGNKPVGTGPYSFVSWQKGVEIRLTANPTYWGDKPSIQDVTVKAVPEASSRVAQLETGEADLITELPPSLADRVKGLSNAQVQEIPINRRIFLFFNTFEGPTADVRIRQAINYAIDANSIIKNVFDGHAAPLKGIYIPGEMGYTADFPGFAYDPNKAKQLLADAGYPNGLTVDFNYTIGAYLLDKEVAEAIQGQLSKVGITAKMNGGAISAISQQYGTEKSQGINFFSFAPLYFDPSFVMNVHFSSKGLYRYNFEQKQDDMIQKALETADPAAREAQYQELQRFLVLEKVVWVPLYVLQDLVGVSNRLTWTMRPDQLFDVSHATLK